MSFQIDASNNHDAFQTETQTQAVRTAAAGQPGYNFRDGYYDSWQEQSLFFAAGAPVQGNSHLRRFTFTDGSFVTVQAHKPGLDCSSANTLLSSMALQGQVSSEYVSQQMQTPIHDAAWQGYTATYYASANATEAWGTRYFYGWVTTPVSITPVHVGGTTDPDHMPDFAMARPAGITWWKWKSGNAEPRTGASQTLSPSNQSEPIRSHQLQASALIHSMATIQTESMASLVANAHVAIASSNSTIGIAH